MTREAVLVANSVTYSNPAFTVKPSVLGRIVNRFSKALEELPASYGFHVTKVIDASPRDVRAKVEAAAERAASSNSLFLFYYFGHGVLGPDFELLFLHPRETNQDNTLRLSTIENIVKDVKTPKSLFIVDCCYAGALVRTFTSTLSGEHCRIASTTPSSRAYVFSNEARDPIGIFTRSILNGLSSHRARKSITDNRITADTLFAYAQHVTREDTSGIQEPTMIGRLTEPITEYLRKPEIIRGITPDADEKTAYRKILAICLTLASIKTPTNLTTLYHALLKSHRKSFETLYKTSSGLFSYQAVKPIVVYRYLRVMRALRLIADDNIELSLTGKRLVAHWKSNYNARLLDSIDSYLSSLNLGRGDIERALQQILENRGVPSRTEITDYIALRQSIPKDTLGIILDLLGYMRAIGMSPSRAYFPWTSDGP